MPNLLETLNLTALSHSEYPEVDLYDLLFEGESQARKNVPVVVIATKQSKKNQAGKKTRKERKLESRNASTRGKARRAPPMQLSAQTKQSLDIQEKNRANLQEWKLARNNSKTSSNSTSWVGKLDANFKPSEKLEAAKTTGVTLLPHQRPALIAWMDYLPIVDKSGNPGPISNIINMKSIFRKLEIENLPQDILGAPSATVSISYLDELDNFLKKREFFYNQLDAEVGLGGGDGGYDDILSFLEISKSSARAATNTPLILSLFRDYAISAMTASPRLLELSKNQFPEGGVYLTAPRANATNRFKMLLRTSADRIDESLGPDSQIALQNLIYQVASELKLSANLPKGANSSDWDVSKIMSTPPFKESMFPAPPTTSLEPSESDAFGIINGIKNAASGETSYEYPLERQDILDFGGSGTHPLSAPDFLQQLLTAPSTDTASTGTGGSSSGISKGTDQAAVSGIGAGSPGGGSKVSGFYGVSEKTTFEAARNRGTDVFAAAAAKFGVSGNSSGNSSGAQKPVAMIPGGSIIPGGGLGIITSNIKANPSTDLRIRTGKSAISPSAQLAMPEGVSFIEYADPYAEISTRYSEACDKLDQLLHNPMGGLGVPSQKLAQMVIDRITLQLLRNLFSATGGWNSIYSAKTLTQLMFLDLAAKDKIIMGQLQGYLAKLDVQIRTGGYRSQGENTTPTAGGQKGGSLVDRVDGSNSQKDPPPDPPGGIQPGKRMQFKNPPSLAILNGPPLGAGGGGGIGSVIDLLGGGGNGGNNGNGNGNGGSGSAIDTLTGGNNNGNGNGNGDAPVESNNGFGGGTTDKNNPQVQYQSDVDAKLAAVSKSAAWAKADAAAKAAKQNAVASEKAAAHWAAQNARDELLKEQNLLEKEWNDFCGETAQLLFDRIRKLSSAGPLQNNYSLSKGDIQSALAGQRNVQDPKNVLGSTVQLFEEYYQLFMGNTIGPFTTNNSGAVVTRYSHIPEINLLAAWQHIVAKTTSMVFGDKYTVTTNLGSGLVNSQGAISICIDPNDIASAVARLSTFSNHTTAPSSTQDQTHAQFGQASRFSGLRGTNLQRLNSPLAGGSGFRGSYSGGSAGVISKTPATPPSYASPADMVLPTISTVFDRVYESLGAEERTVTEFPGQVRAWFNKIEAYFSDCRKILSQPSNGNGTRTLKTLASQGLNISRDVYNVLNNIQSRANSDDGMVGGSKTKEILLSDSSKQFLLEQLSTDWFGQSSSNLKFMVVGIPAGMLESLSSNPSSITALSRSPTSALSKKYFEVKVEKIDQTRPDREYFAKTFVFPRELFVKDFAEYKGSGNSAVMASSQGMRYNSANVTKTDGSSLHNQYTSASLTNLKNDYALKLYSDAYYNVDFTESAFPASSTAQTQALSPAIIPVNLAVVDFQSEVFLSRSCLTFSPVGKNTLPSMAASSPILSMGSTLSGEDVPVISIPHLSELSALKRPQTNLPLAAFPVINYLSTAGDIPANNEVETRMELGVIFERTLCLPINPYDFQVDNKSIGAQAQNNNIVNQQMDIAEKEVTPGNQTSHGVELSTFRASIGIPLKSKYE